MEMIDFWKGKKVLVTGHTGFKGSWLSYWLTQKGAQVFGYSLEPESSPNLFTAAGISRSVPTTFANICDTQALKKCFQQVKPDVVFHMAAQALVRASYADPVETFQTNVMGCVSVFEAARELKPRVLINVTTDKCYENREWAWGYRENEPMGGADPYSGSKACAEIVSSAYRRSFLSAAGIRLATARAGNVIGGGDWAADRLIPDCVRSLTSNGPIHLRNPKSSRPWQHVLDPLSGYMLLAQRLWDDEAFADAWNFGPTHLEFGSVGEVVKAFVSYWPNPPQVTIEQKINQPHEAQSLSLDCSKARTQLGWQSRLGLKESLQMTASWYFNFIQGQSARDLIEKDIARFQSNTEANRWA